ncbi:MAG: hypothetical protein WCF03_19695 [Nitrososphaeraceae archaeon]
MAISKSIGVLMLNGENDAQTPVQQAFLLQQRLTDVSHPDHTLITYPNLGHFFNPSSPWFTESLGPFEPYVLADLLPMHGLQLIHGFHILLCILQVTWRQI